MPPTPATFFFAGRLAFDSFPTSSGLASMFWTCAFERGAVFFNPWGKPFSFSPLPFIGACRHLFPFPAKISVRFCYGVFSRLDSLPWSLRGKGTCFFFLVLLSHVAAFYYFTQFHCTHILGGFPLFFFLF